MTFTLDGFEIGERIGSGGFGEVWEARQLGVDRLVAIKVGNTPISDAQDQLRFERECKALGRLSTHPNIVTVYTSSRLPDGRPVLVLEFVDGGTLQHWARNNPSTEPQLLNLGSDLAAAVLEAHRHKILHRDLKPQNVLLRTTGEAILADFGIAQLQDGLRTVTGNVTASAAYAAPEVLDGERASERADLYGIGICLLAAATQSTPFTNSEDDTLFPVLTRVLTAAPPDLTESGYTPELNSLVQRLLAKDPTERPDSATSVLAEFQGLNAGLHRHQRVTPAAHSAAARTAAAGTNATDEPATVNPSQQPLPPESDPSQPVSPPAVIVPEPVPSAPQTVKSAEPPTHAVPAAPHVAPPASVAPANSTPTAANPVGAPAFPAAETRSRTPAPTTIALAAGGILLALVALFFLFGRSNADPTVAPTGPTTAPAQATEPTSSQSDPTAPVATSQSDPTASVATTAPGDASAPVQQDADPDATADAQPSAAAVQPLPITEPQEVAGALDIALDFRDYPIELVAGQEVSVEVKSMNNSCARSDGFDLRIDVLDADGRPIGNDAWPGNSGCKGFGGDDWTAPSSGVYTVRFSSGPGSASMASTGSFEATIATLRRQRTSIDVTTLQNIAGAIDVARDSTSYELDLRVGQVLGVGMVSINGECTRSSYFDLHFALLDPAGNQLGRDEWPGNGGCRTSGRWAVETDGRHTLMFFSEDDTGEFEAVVGLLLQPTEKLDAAQRANTVGHVFEIPRDEIFYEIELTTGQAISVEVNSINGACTRSSYFDLRLEVLDPQGNRVGNDAWPGNSGCSAYGPWQAESDGVYQVRFYEDSGGAGGFEATIGRLGN